MGTAAAIAGGSIIGGALSSQGAKSASRTSAKASNRATAEQRRQFDILQQNLAPYRGAGYNALDQLQGMTGNLPQFQGTPDFQFNLQADPGYNFALNEAMRAATRGAASQGKLGSGNLLMDLQNRATGLASQYAPQAFNQQLQTYNTNRENALTDYGLNYQRQGDIYSRLSGLANMGLGTVNTQGQAGTNMANSIGNILQNNAGNQIDATNFLYGGLNNAIQGGLSNYIGYQTNQNMMDLFKPTPQYSQFGPYAGGYRYPG